MLLVGLALVLVLVVVGGCSLCLLLAAVGRICFLVVLVGGVVAVLGCWCWVSFGRRQLHWRWQWQSGWWIARATRIEFGAKKEHDIATTCKNDNKLLAENNPNNSCQLPNGRPFFLPALGEERTAGTRPASRSRQMLGWSMAS